MLMSTASSSTGVLKWMSAPEGESALSRRRYEENVAAGGAKVCTFGVEG